MKYATNLDFGRNIDAKGHTRAFLSPIYSYVLWETHRSTTYVRYVSRGYLVSIISFRNNF